MKKYLMSMAGIFILFLLSACGKQPVEEISYVDIVPKQSEPVVLIPEDYVEEEHESVASSEEMQSEEDIAAFADQKMVSYEIAEEVYENDTVHIVFPVLTGMENTELQNQMNQNIKSLVLSRVNLQNAVSTDIKYEIASKGTGILSVIFRGTISCMDKVYPENIVMTVNLDLSNGEFLRLKDYADLAVVVSCLEQDYGYEMVSSCSKEEFSGFLNNGYVTDYAITMLDYDFDLQAPQFLTQGYSCIRDNRLVLFVQTEHSLGDYVEIEFVIDGIF